MGNKMTEWKGRMKSGGEGKGKAEKGGMMN